MTHRWLDSDDDGKFWMFEEDSGSADAGPFDSLAEVRAIFPDASFDSEASALEAEASCFVDIRSETPGPAESA